MDPNVPFQPRPRVRLRCSTLAFPVIPAFQPYTPPSPLIRSASIDRIVKETLSLEVPCLTNAPIVRVEFSRDAAHLATASLATVQEVKPDLRSTVERKTAEEEKARATARAAAAKEQAAKEQAEKEARQKREDERKAAAKAAARARAEEKKKRSSIPYLVEGKTSFQDVGITILGNLGLNLMEKKLSLLFRASNHGWKTKDFHSLCDGKGPTVTLVRVEAKGKTYLFGGYTSVSWDSKRGWRSDGSAALFSLVNASGQPKLMRIKQGEEESAIRCYCYYGPRFGGGHDLIISGDANRNTNSFSNLGTTYDYSGCSIPSKEFMAGSYRFTVADYEVHSVA